MPFIGKGSFSTKNFLNSLEAMIYKITILFVTLLCILVVNKIMFMSAIPQILLKNKYYGADFAKSIYKHTGECLPLSETNKHLFWHNNPNDVNRKWVWWKNRVLCFFYIYIFWICVCSRLFTSGKTNNICAKQITSFPPSCFSRDIAKSCVLSFWKRFLCFAIVSYNLISLND